MKKTYPMTRVQLESNITETTWNQM